MKKLLVGLLLVGSALSFGATQRVPLEKLGPRGNGRELYLEGQAKPYSGEVERKYPKIPEKIGSNDKIRPINVDDNFF